jgi:predicted acetyltransferase
VAVYRTFPDDQDELFYEYMQYGFSPEDGPAEYDAADRRYPVGDRRGLYRSHERAEDPLSVCRHYWLDATVRGSVHPIAGLTSVITPPEHRRDGYVTELLEEVLREYRERDRHFTVLWPFDYGFYRSFGWETVSNKRVYSGDLDALAFAAAEAPPGRYRRLSTDDFASVEPVYDAFSSDYSFTLVRDAEWWRTRVCRARDTEPFVYVWEREGDPEAYLVYTFEDDADGRTLSVREVGYTGVDGLLAALAFCYNHDSQAERFELTVPDDTVVQDLLTQPNELDCALHTRPMARLVDVTAALEGMRYPLVDESVTVAVADDLAPWNDDTFELSVVDGDGTCQPTDEPSAVELDVATLTQLVTGYRTAGELARADRIEATDPTAVRALDRLFPATTTFFNDGF